MPEFIADTIERLDKFVAVAASVSRGRVQKAIKDGLVKVNGEIVSESDLKLAVGDKVEAPEFKALDKLKPYDFELKIVFENDDLAVIDKPAGLVVHPGAGNKENTLANALLHRFPGIEKVGDPHRPGIVHRLDEDTSGLILIAKSPQAFEYLRQMFLEKQISKEYLALVHGVPDLHGVIDVPLEKNPRQQKMSVFAKSYDGSADSAFVAKATSAKEAALRVGGKVRKVKEAVTEYWVIDYSNLFSPPGGDVTNGDREGQSPSPGPSGHPLPKGEGSNELDQYALLRVKLHTGRTHQIRAHLSHIGHPILGDATYGGQFKKSDPIILNRQFLHAFCLKFKLLDGSQIELFSELPDDLKQVLAKTGIIYDDQHIR